MRAINVIALGLILSCSICACAAGPSDTEIKVRNIQAMLYKKIYTEIVIKYISGPDELHTLVLRNPTYALITEDYKINSNSSDNTTILFNTPAPPSVKKDNLKKIINELPDTVPLNEFKITYNMKEEILNNYKYIISNVIVETPKLSPVDQRRYDEANEIMNEEVSGSLIGRTSGEYATKLEVYRYFRSIYFNAREEKEKELENQKNTLNTIEYRRWYMYNYRKLKDNEKSALQDWVIRGYKKVIEEALETVNINDETPNVELEDAKNAIEAVVYDPIDHIYYYDAELSPSNWQEHLYEKIHDPTPTSSQYLNMILHLKEYSIVMQAIGKAYESEAAGAQTEINTEEPDVKAQEAALIDKAASLIKQLEACHELTGDCLGIDELAESQKNDTKKWKDDQTDLDENKLVLANSENYKTAIDNLVQKIGDKIIDYEKKYSAAKLEELAEENDFLVPHEFPEDEWKSFYFNSEKEFQEHDEQSGRFASFQPEIIDDKFVNILEKRSSKTLELEVDMHYIGINVYRDWFHGNIFKNPMIKPGDDSLISPGYVDDLNKVLKKKLSNGDPLYKFPLYPSGLLIAKDIKMTIRGLNEDATRLLIENSYNPDQLGIAPPEIISEDMDDSPYNHIGSIFGFSYSNLDSHAVRYRVKEDFDGVYIELLEPHFIGQFCDIIPKF